MVDHRQRLSAIPDEQHGLRRESRRESRLVDTNRCAIKSGVTEVWWVRGTVVPCVWEVLNTTTRVSCVDINTGDSQGRTGT